MEIATGTRVLVTGASRGIGRAVCEAFAARGCVLGLVARSEDELRELATALPGEGHTALPADVSSPDSIRQAVVAFEPFDVLVANAGVANYGDFVQQELEQAERMTRINWLGTVYTVAAALPAMLAAGRGHVVVVASGASLRTFPGAAVYGATKSAQRGFAEALRHELAGTGVSLTTVYPGEIKTALHAHERDRMPAWYRTDEAVAPEPLAERIVSAVERDARDLYYPPIVRLLRVMNGLSPRLADAILRTLRGRAAAPRR